MLTLDRGRPTAAALKATREQCAAILWPKLKRLVNPNVVGAWIRLSIHVQDGTVNHVKSADSRPGYVHALPENGMEEHPAARRALTDSLAELQSRLADVLGEPWHGTVTLIVAINGASASIDSEEERVYRVGSK